MPDNIQHPINAFPEKLQEIINHYSEIKGYPAEFFISQMLGAFSTALGRSVTLKTGNFQAIGIIWSVIVAKPGMTKSESQSDAFKPLKKLQFEFIKQYERDLAELEELEKNKKDSDKTVLAQPKRFILNDITPEALSMTLANNPRGCCIVYDELAGFVGRFDRYSSGADEQMFLSLFNGDSIIRTRVDSKSNAAIKNSFCSIVGTIQPAVMKTVFNNKSASGFFDRWLISHPENIKKAYPNMYSIDPVFESYYTYMIEKVMHVPMDEAYPIEMSYTPTSYKIVNEFECSIVDIQNNTDNDNERSILAKMQIYVHRFSLILQSILYSLPAEFEDPSMLLYVSDEAATGAVILARYFLSEAHKMRVVNPVEYLKDNWVNIYNALPPHGKPFDRSYFIKVCDKFGFKQRAADKFLKENANRDETSLFFKIKHGEYTKNLF